jgi:hypothetical protein
VEGYELRALQGAGELLTRFKPLVCVELFPPVMQRHAATPEAIAELLAEHGYQLFVAQKNSLVPLTALPFGDQRYNVFGFHEKHFEEGIAPCV